VREEEPAHGIVWVGIGFGIFMMDAMIASPVVDGSLVRDGVTQHEEETDGEGSGVGAVRPKTVDADSDAEATNRPQQKCPHQYTLSQHSSWIYPTK